MCEQHTTQTVYRCAANAHTACTPLALKTHVVMHSQQNAVNTPDTSVEGLDILVSAPKVGK